MVERVEESKFRDDFVVFVSTDSMSARGVVEKRYGEKVVFHSNVIDMTTRQVLFLFFLSPSLSSPPSHSSSPPFTPREDIGQRSTTE